MESPSLSSLPVVDSSSISRIDPRFDAVYVTLACPSCGRSFTSAQCTLGGVPVGEHVCPECDRACRIPEAEYFEAVAGFWPEPSLSKLVSLLAEASRILHTWPAQEEIQTLLAYDDIPLGEHCRHAPFDVVAGCLLALQTGS